ncbi:hypothetical protein STEG23_032723, partial [Scotinomys teguina]
MPHSSTLVFNIDCQLERIYNHLGDKSLDMSVWVRYTRLWFRYTRLWFLRLQCFGNTCMANT